MIISKEYVLDSENGEFPSHLFKEERKSEPEKSTTLMEMLPETDEILTEPEKIKLVGEEIKPGTDADCEKKADVMKAEAENTENDLKKEDCKTDIELTSVEELMPKSETDNEPEAEIKPEDETKPEAEMPKAESEPDLNDVQMAEESLNQGGHDKVSTVDELYAPNSPKYEAVDDVMEKDIQNVCYRFVNGEQIGFD